jgi:hypothetical protein
MVQLEIEAGSEAWAKFDKIINDTLVDLEVLRP